MSEAAALVALLRVRPKRLTWHEITAEVVAEGSALSVCDRLMYEGMIPVVGDVDALTMAQREVDAWRAQGLAFLTILDEGYPERLRGVHEAPPILFARGRLLENDPAVSVVGSRKASDRGLQIARTIADMLAQSGITVLSGLAAGIDTAAHTAALDAGGRTVAVIGTGITGYYPAKNRALQDRIAEEGLVLSQFWPDAPPRSQHFPMRNATMSGYGLATVVVEAGERSGARIQARVAVEHGRPVMLTDLVVERNEWAKALVGRPGVHVVAGVNEVRDIVSDINAEPATVEELLTQLTA